MLHPLSAAHIKRAARRPYTGNGECWVSVSHPPGAACLQAPRAVKNGWTRSLTLTRTSPPRDDRVMDNSDAVAKSRITSADSSEDHDDEGTSSNAKAPVSRKRKTKAGRDLWTNGFLWMDACK